MLLYDKKTGIKYESVLAACDEAEYQKLCGNSALAKSIQAFEINLQLIKLPDDLKKSVMEAQERQRMVNA